MLTHGISGIFRLMIDLTQIKSDISRLTAADRKCLSTEGETRGGR
jgi:hypothetical protein